MRYSTRLIAAFVASALAAALTVVLAGPGNAAERWFSDSDPVNLGVSANGPQAYSNSSTLAAKFGSSADDANVATSGNSMMVKQATASTPHYHIEGRQTGWGPNPFVHDAYWDPSWQLQNGQDNADGWVVIIAPDKSYATECWQATIVNGKLSCQWGDESKPTGSATDVNGAPTGSGFARLAGVIDQDDWNNGIDHALVYGTPDNDGSYVYPATRTDGSGSGVMHEGDFIWMDKSGSCANPSGLTTAQQRVYKALQDYGAFNVDNAQTFGFGSEASATPPGGDGGGWLSMRALPWASCLHVGKVTKGGVSPSPSSSPTQTATPTSTPTTPTPTPTQSPTGKLSAGNVCRASASDNDNWWAVANIGDNAVNYTSYVMYNGSRTNGPSGTIQPGQVKSIMTGNGGGLHVAYNGTEALATSNSSIHCA